MSRKKTDIWMPLYVAEYLGDTMHLTTRQHGAYLLLIMAYWRNAGPLPNDDRRLATICRLAPADWSEDRNTLAEFFEVIETSWRHKRIEVELVRSLEQAQKASDRGRSGAAKRWGKESLENASSNAQAMPDTMLADAPSPSPSPSPIQTKPRPKKTLPAAATQTDGTDLAQEQCRAVWKAYSNAYLARYGTAPVRNAKVNGQIRNLVSRLGSEAAPVAEFYVSINDQFILKRLHDFGLLVSQAEAIRTQWATGRAMTSTRARQLDQTAANASAADESIAMLRARNAAKEAGQ